MIRINLLPHREERRKAQRRQFGVMAVFVFGISLGIAALVHGVFVGYLSVQAQRNEFLKRTTAEVDKEITEIKRLQDEIQALLSRKQIIESLQSDRSRPVLLLENLVTQTPDGVYLRTVKQTGTKVQVTGFAQSSARVSMFMRNLQGTDLVLSSATSPKLIEIKNGTPVSWESC